MTSVTKFPGTAASAGTNPVAWVNPGNAKATDSVYATMALPGSGTYEQYLLATNFGFSIPTGATINGFEFIILGHVSAGTITPFVGPTKTGDTTFAGGVETTPTFANTSDATTTLGSSTDLWGTTWAPSDVNSSSFGWLFSSAGSAAATLSVDSVSVTVYYTLPTVTRDVTSAAAISATIASNVTSAAAVSAPVARDVTSAGAVKRTVTRDVTSAAAVTTPITRDVTSAAAISRTLRDVTSAAALTAPVVRNVTSAAAIKAAVTSDVPSAAAISAQVASNVTSAAAISAAIVHTTVVAQLATAANQGVYTLFQVPADASATSLTITPYWAAAAADAGTHAVCWQANVLKADPLISLTNTGQSVVWNGAAAARTANVVVADTPQVLPGSFVAADIVRIELDRLGTQAADTFTQTVNLIGFEISYTSTL